MEILNWPSNTNPQTFIRPPWLSVKKSKSLNANFALKSIGTFSTALLLFDILVNNECYIKSPSAEFTLVAFSDSSYLKESTEVEEKELQLLQSILRINCILGRMVSSVTINYSRYLGVSRYGEWSCGHRNNCYWNS